MARITMLAPFKDTSPLTQFAREEFRHLPDLTVIGLNTGIDLVIEYYQIEYHLGPIIDKAIEIEKRRDCDALIIGCFGDPGLLAVRQVTSMPVLGTGEASLSLAAMLGDKIGIIVPKNFVYIIEKLIQSYPCNERVVAVRSTEAFDPEILTSRPKESVGKMVDTCLRVIRQDDADVVVCGCIGFSWMVRQVRELVAKEGFKTPIIEPGITVYNAAKMVVELGLNQDRRKFGVSL